MASSRRLAASSHNVRLFPGRTALFAGLSVPCPASGHTEAEMSEAGCERRAQGEDCLRNVGTLNKQQPRSRTVSVSSPQT